MGKDYFINACIGGEFIVTEKLTGGSFGEIYVARSRSNGQLVAVKLVHLFAT